MTSSNRSSMSRNGGLLGYEADEHAQILTAIRQPLFIQTPLQAMLESLVDKLQAQAGILAGFQNKVSSLERTQLGQHELLDRMRVLESRLEVSHGPSSALSPFNQQELLTRLQQLEQKAELLDQQTQKLRHSTEEDLESRLKVCETRLAGVHNLAGRLIAVDLIAAELDITVPEPQMMTHQQIQQIEQQLAQAQQQQQGQQYWDSDAAAWDGPASLSLTGAQQQQQLAVNSRPSTAAGLVVYSSNSSRPQSGSVAAGALTKSKQAELQQQIDAGREQATKMQHQLGDLQQQVARLAGDVSSSQDSTMGVLAGLQDTCQGLSDRLSQQVVQLRKEMQPALQQGQQGSVSLAEIAEMHSKLDGAVAAAAAANKEVQQIKSKVLPPLNTAITELTRRVGKGPTAAVSDADKALAAELAVLRDQVSGLGARLDAQEAEDLAKEGVATKEDLQELSRLMLHKASKDDMRAVLGRAVDLALQAYRSSVGEADNSGASRTRCLVCERTLVGSRSGSPLRDSVPGSSTTGRGLPQFDAFRPSTAAAAYTGPASAGETLGFGPLGPGLNAAQLRRMADQKALGTAGADSDQQQGEGGGEQSVVGSLLSGSLVVRATSPALGNSVKYSSPGAYNPKQQGGGLAGSISGKGRPHTVPVTGPGGGGQQIAAAGQRPVSALQGASRGSMRQSGQGDEQQQQPGRRQPGGRRNPVFV